MTEIATVNLKNMGKWINNSSLLETNGSIYPFLGGNWSYFSHFLVFLVTIVTIRFTIAIDDKDLIANAKEWTDVHRQSPNSHRRCIADTTNFMVSMYSDKLIA